MEIWWPKSRVRAAGRHVGPNLEQLSPNATNSYILQVCVSKVGHLHLLRIPGGPFGRSPVWAERRAVLAGWPVWEAFTALELTPVCMVKHRCKMCVIASPAKQRGLGAWRVRVSYAKKAW
eukprot:1152462-Pelagomonas_calceolata.AAC.2